MKTPWIWVFFALVVALGATLPATDAYEIDGDMVFIDDSNVFIGAMPHTVTLKDCITGENRNPLCAVQYGIISKHYTGNTTIALGFDSDTMKPVKAETWAGGQWVQIPNAIFERLDVVYDGKDLWYTTDNVLVEAGVLYKLRVWAEITKKGAGKYDFAIKPTAETFAGALASGHLYILDPWFNVNFTRKIEVRTSCSVCTANTTIPLAVNITVGGLPQWFYCNVSIPTVNNKALFIYWNNYTDYVCINATETGQFLDLDMEQGNRTDMGQVWGTDHMDVLHADAAAAGTAADATLRGANWSVTGGVTYNDTYGMFGKSFQFDGSNCDVASNIGGGASGFQNGTIMLWYWPAGSDHVGYLSRQFAAAGTQISLEVYDSGGNAGVYFYIANGTNNRYSVSTYLLSVGTWHHLVFTWNLTEMRTYMDGSLRNVTKGINGPSTPTAYLFFGSAGGATAPIKGLLDEIRVLNRSVTIDEVRAIWNTSWMSSGASAVNETGFFINLTSPANTTYGAETIPITYQTGSCNWSAYSLDGAANVSLGCANTTFTPSGYGAHNFTIYMNNSDNIMLSQTVYFTSGYPVGSCPGAGYVAYNFSFADEETFGNLTANISLSFVISTPISNYTYNATITNATCLGICTDGGTYNGDMFLEYSATGYTKRYYFLDNAVINNATNNIKLYLLPDTVAADVTFNIYDAYQNPQQGIIVYANRYFPSIADYKTVAMGRSNAVGQSVISLKMSEWYTYILISDGAVANIYTLQHLTGTPVSLFSTTGSDVGVLSYLGSVAYACDYNATTYMLICTYADTSGKTQFVNLTVEDRGFNASGWRTVCYDDITAVSGSLSCNLTGSMNSSLVYFLTGSYCCSDMTLFLWTTGTVIVGTLAEIFGDFGLTGVFAAMIFFITIAGIGFYEPRLAIILGLVGFIIISPVMQILPADWVSTGGVIVVGAFLLFMTSGRGNKNE